MKTLKKIILTGAACFYVSGLFAGGLLTNTNQSVHFLRNPARNASTEIDAVYTNPAGLAKLSEEGWHFSLNNQSAFQTRTISSTFAPFGSEAKDFEGKATAPFIPSLLGAYKKGDWVFSGSVSVIGGGGTLSFDKGLPSFESQVATQVFAPLTQLNAAAINSGYAGSPAGYSLDMSLDGTSIIYAVQLGATYKINDNFSVFAGGRMSIVDNAYKGYMRNVSITDSEGLKTHFTNTAAYLNGLGQTDMANALTGAAAGVTQLENGVAATNIALDCSQSGLGIAPILGFNFNWDQLNIGVKYEFLTKIDLENKTEIDDTGMFPDKAKTPYDIPSILTVGAQYDIVPCVTVSASWNHFFDSDAKMANDKQKYINGGINDYMLGAEWRINKRFLVSAGGIFTRTGVTDDYQADMNFFLNSNSFCFGGAVNVSESVRINLGCLFTNYEDWSKESTSYYNAGMPGTEVFSRTNMAFGVGVDFRF